MKTFAACLLILFLTTACNSVETWVHILNEKSPLPENSRCYVYYSDEQSIPDSNYRIGTVLATLTPGGKFEGFSTYQEALALLEEDAKYAGANLMSIKVDKERGSRLLITGKIYSIPEFETTEYTENSLSYIWRSKKPDPIEGVYESNLEEFGSEYEGDWANYAVVKRDSQNYVMIYLSGYEGMNCYYLLNNIEKFWRPGDVCAYIQTTEKPNLYKIKQYEYNKFLKPYTMLQYDDGNLRMMTQDAFKNYRKRTPSKAPYYVPVGGLTGFYIGDGRIMTCYHGVNDNEKKIIVKGVNGNFEKKVCAELESFDKDNDIAIVRIKDSASVNSPALAFDASTKRTGDEVFVMGYPITPLMGEEIKLTNGIISSTSGRSGDLAAYQISAAVQPGNSGSPLFDRDGNLIGMINSKITVAENVGYSIKLEQINSFLKSKGITSPGAAKDTYKNLSLPEKVETLRNSIFIIEIVDDSEPKQNHNPLR